MQVVIVIYLKTDLEETRKMGINGAKYVKNNVSTKAVGSEREKVFEERLQKFADFSTKTRLIEA